MVLIKMNILNKSVTYLIGSIQNDPNLGCSWRQRFVELVSPIGIKCLDPTNKPAGLVSEVKEEQEFINSLKKEQRWHDLRDYMKKIWRADLRFCDLCDFAVWYVDPKIPTWGSTHEATVILNSSKPLLIICKGGLGELPQWLFAMARPEEVFPTIEDCVQYLKDINGGKIDISNDKRWILIRNYI